MKVQVKHFAESSFESLIDSKKSVKIAKCNKSKVEYWFDPKQSCVFGYEDGKTTMPVFEAAIKDQDYLDALLGMLGSNPNIKLYV